MHKERSFKTQQKPDRDTNYKSIIIMHDSIFHTE